MTVRARAPPASAVGSRDLEEGYRAGSESSPNRRMEFKRKIIKRANTSRSGIAMVQGESIQQSDLFHRVRKSSSERRIIFDARLKRSCDAPKPIAQQHGELQQSSVPSPKPVPNVPTIVMHAPTEVDWLTYKIARMQLQKTPKQTFGRKRRSSSEPSPYSPRLRSERDCQPRLSSSQYKATACAQSLATSMAVLALASPTEKTKNQRSSRKPSTTSTPAYVSKVRVPKKIKKLFGLGTPSWLFDPDAPVPPPMRKDIDAYFLWSERRG